MGNSDVSRKKEKKSILYELIKNKFLYLLTLPGIIFFIVFAYIPMGGLVMAFQDFKLTKGIFGSKFNGVKNFEFFFSSDNWYKITFNTVYLNALFIITGTFLSVMIAVMLSEMKNKSMVKVTQSIVILPHFLSWTVVSMFCISMLSTDSGFINKTLESIGISSVQFYSMPAIWPILLVIIRIWQGAGFGSIVYIASIAGINNELYEAAKIDGASRLQSIFNITLPMLKSTIVLLTLFSVGKIFNGDFGMIYSIVGDNTLLYPTTDVIDTYIYRALRQLNDVGMSTAVSFYQSFVGFLLVISANSLAKKIDSDSAIF